MTRTCAVCRTSLDEHPLTCEHGEVFCGGCWLEDGCDECRLDLLLMRANSAWNAGPAGWSDPAKDAQIDAAAEERADRRAVELAHLEYREGML